MCVSRRSMKNRTLSILSKIEGTPLRGRGWHVCICGGVETPSRRGRKWYAILRKLISVRCRYYWRSVRDNWFCPFDWLFVTHSTVLLTFLLLVMSFTRLTASTNTFLKEIENKEHTINHDVNEERSGQCSIKRLIPILRWPIQKTKFVKESLAPENFFLKKTTEKEGNRAIRGKCAWKEDVPWRHP